MKKTMRKSALLSSVAMLIVSAIVLTSATYAWFSSSDRVDVQQISTTVESSTGLLISIDEGKSWKTSVSVEDFKPENFSPVSTATGAENSWVTGGYKDEKLNLGAATAGDEGQFMMYDLWVKGPDGETVTVNPDFLNTAANVKNVLKFALYDTKAKAWLDNGVIAATKSDIATYVGTSANTAVEAETETGAYLVDGTTINEIDGYTFELDGVHEFIAYVWVEGNDADCTFEKITSGSAVEFAVNMTLDSYQG